MKWLCLVLGLAGCESYFGGDKPIPPDTFSADVSGGGECPDARPQRDAFCHPEQGGLVCTYPSSDAYEVCRCSFGDASSSLWECGEATFDAGVDGP